MVLMLPSTKIDQKVQLGFRVGFTGFNMDLISVFAVCSVGKGSSKASTGFDRGLISVFAVCSVGK